MRGLVAASLLFASLNAAIKSINKDEIYRLSAELYDDFELSFAVKAAIEEYKLETENRSLLTIVRQQALNLLKFSKKSMPVSRKSTTMKKVGSSFRICPI